MARSLSLKTLVMQFGAYEGSIHTMDLKASHVSIDDQSELFCPWKMVQNGSLDRDLNN